MHSDQQRVGRPLFQGGFGLPESRVNVRTGRKEVTRLSSTWQSPNGSAAAASVRILAGPCGSGAARARRRRCEEFRCLPALPQHERLRGLLVETQVLVVPP